MYMYGVYKGTRKCTVLLALLAREILCTVYLAFLVISDSVFILHPAMTGIAQAATGYILYNMKYINSDSCQSNYIQHVHTFIHTYIHDVDHVHMFLHTVNCMQ